MEIRNCAGVDPSYALENIEWALISVLHLRFFPSTTNVCLKSGYFIAEFIKHGVEVGSCEREIYSEITELTEEKILPLIRQYQSS